MNTAKEFVGYQELLESVPTMTAAIERCYLLAGKSAKEAAWEMGIDYCHFRRMMRATDSRHFPPDLIELLMKKMGNQFPLDWLAHRMGLVCYPLEFIRILDGIRDALRVEGRTVNFSAGDIGDEAWEKLFGK